MRKFWNFSRSCLQKFSWDSIRKFNWYILFKEFLPENSSVIHPAIFPGMKKWCSFRGSSRSSICDSWMIFFGDFCKRSSWNLPMTSLLDSYKSIYRIPFRFVFGFSPVFLTGVSPNSFFQETFEYAWKRLNRFHIPSQSLQHHDSRLPEIFPHYSFRCGITQ